MEHDFYKIETYFKVSFSDTLETKTLQTVGSVKEFYILKYSKLTTLFSLILISKFFILKIETS